MSFSNLKINDPSIKEQGDVLPSGNRLVDSDLYNATVTLAYQEKSKSSEAHCVNLRLKTESGNELRFQVWYTNGKNEPFFEDKKTKEKQFLPGFTLLDNLCLLTVGKNLADMDVEEKTIKLWDKEAKGEVPTKAQVIPELIGKEIIAGILKQTVDKQTKNQLTGAYESTGETRDENVLDKVFRASDRLTVTEIRKQVTEPVFIELWKQQYAGKVLNKAKGAKAGANAGTPGMPAQASAAPRQSLFAPK